MINVYPESFSEDPDKPYPPLVTGTVEVSIRGDRRRVYAVKDKRTITVHDLAVRFPTGAKVWPATAIYWFETGDVNNLTPRIDRRARTGSFSLVGFIEDFEKRPSLSQHNGA